MAAPYGNDLAAVASIDFGFEREQCRAGGDGSGWSRLRFGFCGGDGGESEVIEDDCGFFVEVQVEGERDGAFRHGGLEYLLLPFPGFAAKEDAVVQDVGIMIQFAYSG